MMNEKMDLLMYLSENGYDFGNYTFEEIAEAMPIEALRIFVEIWMEE